MERTIKAVLFDIHGTIFDQNLAQKRILERIVRRFPELFAPLDPELVSKAFAESHRLTAGDFQKGPITDNLRQMRSSLFLQMLHLPADLAGAVTESYVESAATVNGAMEGAVPLLRELSGQMPVGAISNGQAAPQRQRLEAMGLSNLLSSIVLSEEIGVKKPDTRIFYYAAGSLRVRPQECLHVGDSFADDVIGAKRAGMLACWFNPEQQAPPNKDGIRADFVISRLRGVSRILEGPL